MVTCGVGVSCFLRYWSYVCVFCQDVFQIQVVGRRQGEFERLKRVREERLAEERALRSQERDIRRKKEYYKQQEEMRVQKIQEEEEARKREGGC